MPQTAMILEERMRMESRQPNSRFTGKRIHFIGIGGCGMSGLARMLLDAGAIVSGSDPKPNGQTLRLAELGAKITRVQDGALIGADTDMVVRTAAIPDANPEFQAALKHNRPHRKYAQFLGEVMQERLGVAVSGTHGKSTTTAMISYALLQCGADPSFVIGGTVKQLGGSSRSGKGSAFVVEACEFDRSFHNYHPRIALITNIEADHLDSYPGGLPEIVESFRVFARRVPADGCIIANGQDGNVRAALAGLATPVEWVGLENSALDWSARVISIDAGCYHAEIFYHGRPVALVRLAVPGKHNLFNATAAVAACAACDVDPAQAAHALGRFEGVDRRMSEAGRYNGAVVVDDYGHHPTEIMTTLRALREKYQPARLVCVFQPHQYSRTRFLLDEFAHAFVDADLTILPSIYAARDSEADRRSVGSEELVDRINHNGQCAIYIPQLEGVVDYLRREARLGDLIVTMGAGNITDVGRLLPAS